MHQPLSDFPRASIVCVFTYKCWNPEPRFFCLFFCASYLHSAGSSSKARILFLLHRYPLFTSPFPFAPLLSPSLLHFELFTSLSSHPPSPPLSPHPQHPLIPPPPPPDPLLWISYALSILVFFCFCWISIPFLTQTRGEQGVECVELHYLRVAHKQRVYVTTY